MAAKFALAMALALYCSVMAEAQPWDGALWENKVTLFFNLYDLNDDGLHDQIDVTKLAAGYKNVNYVKPVQIVATLDLIWLKLYSNVLLAAPGQPLNDQSLIDCAEQLGYVNAVAEVTAAAPLFFLIWDTSCNGLVELSEYKFFMNLLGLSSDVIEASFNELDTDHNGEVTILENTIGWDDYFSTSNPNDPYNILLGPIPVVYT
jgi:hypothetical protein